MMLMSTCSLMSQVNMTHVYKLDIYTIHFEDMLDYGLGTRLSV